MTALIAALALYALATTICGVCDLLERVPVIRRLADAWVGGGGE